MRKILGILLLIALCGCSTTKLEPGGAYAPVDTNGIPTLQPDLAFYVTDASFAIAWSTALAAGDFERNNREVLWRVDPNIKHTMDKIRPQIIAVRNEYIAARKAYIANAPGANLTTLQQILAKAQQLATTAAIVIKPGGQ